MGDLSRALELFNRPETRKLWVIINSLALQVIAVLFHLACARAVGLETPALVFFLVVPASVIVALLPITLNGLGLREGVLVGLLVSAGAPAAGAGAFALLALLVTSSFALIGGIINPFSAPQRVETTRVPLDT